MNKNQPPGRLVLRLLREGRALLLAGQARVTQLVDVIQLRQTTHQALLAEFAQRVEAEVAEPVVPPLGVVAGTCEQGYGLGHRVSDVVQAIH